MPRMGHPPDVLRFKDVERCELEPNQVRIRVHAAGVNFADSLMVAGSYQVKPPFPFIPGLEAAGVIVETDNAVAELRVGQRVLAVLRNGGGYTEEIVLNAASVVAIPDAMDFVTAAAFRWPTGRRITRSFTVRDAFRTSSMVGRRGLELVDSLLLLHASPTTPKERDDILPSA